MRIAVIVACHNRRETTLQCLKALHACELGQEHELALHLVDDGSKDGTADAVRASYPSARIIVGDGSLFWNGGMRVAFESAIALDYDAYLWLNDDTWLFPHALETMLRTLRDTAQCCGGREGVVVGSTCDPETGILTYGGLVRRRGARRHYYEHLAPAEMPQECESLNGNCVLIPRAVVMAIGNIDPAFVHAIGDWDYGFRARKAGFTLWLAPGFVGRCRENPVIDAPLSEQANIRQQLRRVCGPKGVPPRAWIVYVRRHCGHLWPVEFVRPYVGAVARALGAKLRLAQR